MTRVMTRAMGMKKVKTRCSNRKGSRSGHGTFTAERGLVSIFADLLYEKLKDEPEFQELVGRS